MPPEACSGDWPLPFLALLMHSMCMHSKNPISQAWAGLGSSGCFPTTYIPSRVEGVNPQIFRKQLLNGDNLPDAVQGFPHSVFPGVSYGAGAAFVSCLLHPGKAVQILVVVGEKMSICVA